MKSLRAELAIAKKEIATLKDSNENHIFINDKLNKALKRAEQRTEHLQTKLKAVTEESVHLKKQVSVIENKKNSSSVAEQQHEDEDEDEALGEDPFCGDVSSIMVKADMIDNFNIAE